MRVFLVKFSVIIPTLNAQKVLGRCLGLIRSAEPTIELIVCDGGSLDATLQIAADHQAIVVPAPRGRGAQLKEGARLASGEILCFIHADSQLGPKTFSDLRADFLDPLTQIGKLRLVFDKAHPLLRFYTFMARVDSLWTSFGDQGIIIRRSFYEALGGFRDWPLFEDVDLLQRARKRTTIKTLTPMIITSAERFRNEGYLRRQLKNGQLIAEYLRGVSPFELYEKYYC